MNLFGMLFSVDLFRNAHRIVIVTKDEFCVVNESCYVVV